MKVAKLDDVNHDALAAEKKRESLSSTEGLLPCPFCGGEAERSEGKTGDGKPWPYIRCCNYGCGAMAEPEAWNSRPATPTPRTQSQDAPTADFMEPGPMSQFFARKTRGEW